MKKELLPWRRLCRRSTLLLTAALVGRLAAGQRSPAATASAPNVSWTITSKVERASPTSFRYSYIISNSSTSSQAICYWGIEHADAITWAATSSPVGWISSDQMGGPSVSGWSCVLSPLIPGTVATGFQTESNGLPGIISAFAAADVGIDTLPHFAEGQAPESSPDADIRSGSVKLKAIGPIPSAPSASPLSVLVSIIDLEGKASDLGWIKNGIGNSLSAKLNNAKAALQRSDLNATRNILGAFLNELSAQEGKQISADVTAMLRINVESLLDKIAH